NELASIDAFSRLQGIALCLKENTAFHDSFTDTLRLDFGDWRDAITWPSNLIDENTRAALYIERGFDPELTNFPAEALEESLSINGLRKNPPPLVALYGEPVSITVGAETEEDLTRTNQAHEWLLRFETQIRQLIDIILTTHFGPDWPKHCLPKEMRDKWQEKKEKAEKVGGRIFPLIAYADFTDYALLICKRDVWPLFERLFRRQEYVRESFQRLYPVRLATMHARPINSDDELYLFVEIKRFTANFSVVLDKKRN